MHAVRGPFARCFAVDALPLVAVCAPVYRVVVVVFASTHPALSCGIWWRVSGDLPDSLSFGSAFVFASAYGGVGLVAYAAYSFLAVFAYRVLCYAVVAACLPAFLAFDCVVGDGVASAGVVAFVHGVDIELVDVAADVVSEGVVVVGLVC